MRRVAKARAVATFATDRQAANASVGGNTIGLKWRSSGVRGGTATAARRTVEIFRFVPPGGARDA